MRAAVIGFVLGALAILAGVFVARYEAIKISEPFWDYHFVGCLFPTEEFPFGDLDQGSTLRRVFYPLRISTHFYDAQYREVTRATQPGRYGAVIRIDAGGKPSYHFITLYRTPAPVFWTDGDMNVSASLPAGTGVDPAVATVQEGQIAAILRGGERDDPHENLAILLAGLAETSPTAPPATHTDDAKARNDAWWFGLRTKLGLLPYYPFLTDLPRGYDADPGKRWPLILFLHGVGERGENLQVVRHAGLAKVIADGRQLPAIVISPQLPLHQHWSIPALAQLLDDAAARYRVDLDRVYLVGTSAGGDASWRLALTYPDRFAALIDLAGETHNGDFSRLVRLPTWTFDGARDLTINPAAVQAAPAAIAKAGGHPHLTVFPDSGHNCWDQALARDDVYTWLLAQKRGQDEVIPPGMNF